MSAGVCRRAEYVVLFVVALLASSAFAQQPAPDLQAQLSAAIDTLRALSGQTAGPWRFHWPAEPGGEAPDFDDSSWPLVFPEHSWHGDNTAAWYRMHVAVPQRLGAAPNPGGPLVLEVAVDDDGEIYVNGELVKRFHWDQGRAVLTDDARPGQSFVVAVKAINQGGPGRLLSASLRYARLDEIRRAIADHAAALETLRELLSVEAELPAEAMDAVQACLAALDFELVSADTSRFLDSIEASLAALAPLQPIIRKYALYLIGHAHIDMNWLWLWPETIQVCHDTWTQALRFMDEFPDFRFSESQPGAMIAIEERYPDLFAQIKQRILEGRWDPTCATWVQGDTNMASGEALARHALTSREYCIDRFGRWTKTLWLPDNFGHAWTLPTIFRDAGVEWFYFARCAPGVPLFWWEGPDGARLLSYNYGGYGWSLDPGIARAPLDVKRQVGSRAAMIVYGVGDHGGGPTRRDIETALALQKRPFAPQIKFARTDEFFEAALAENAELPVVRRELQFVFRGCYTTHADVKLRNRRLENLLPTAEAAAVAAWLLAGRRYDDGAFTRAWRNVLFNQFHDLLCGSAIHEAYEYTHELYDEAEKIARAELGESLQALGAAIDTRGQGQPLLLFNRLGWKREGVVLLPANDLSAAQQFKAASGPDKSTSPIQAVAIPSAARDSQQIAFRAAVPSCGWAAYHLAAQAAGAPAKVKPVSVSEDERNITVENEFLRLVVEKASGALVSVYDLAGRREIVPEGQRAGLPQVLWEDPHGMSAWEIGRIRWTKDLDEADSVEVSAKGPLIGAVVTRHRWNKSTFTTWIGLRAGSRQVDFRLVANWKEKGTPHEGGPMLKVAFPTNLSQPVFTCDIPFGAVQRALDGQDVPAGMWADLTDVRLTRASGAKPIPVDLTPYFDHDAFATDEQPDDGNFDGGNMNYPASIFASARDGLMDFAGLPWRVPPTDPGASNAVRAMGQTIELPDAAVETITVFGASAPSADGGQAKLVFRDGTQEAVPLSFSDWCFGPEAGEEIAARSPYRLVPSGRTGPECRIFARTYPVPKGRRLAALVLPRAPRLRVFAITLGPRVEARPLYGVALLNDCKYGYDASGSTLRLTLLRASYDPDPEPDVGVHEIGYSLLPHAGGWAEAGVVQAAWELNNPVVAELLDSHAGRLASAASLVSLEPANLILAAVKRAEQGDGLVVRWYESAGHETTARLKLGFGARAARLTNVVEVEDRGPLAIRGGEVLVPTRACGIATVRVVPAPTGSFPRTTRPAS